MPCRTTNISTGSSVMRPEASMPEAVLLTAERAPRDPPAAGRPVEAIDVVAARIAVYRSLAECEVLWRDAATQCAGFVFQTFDWQSAYQATIGAAEGVQPLIVQVTSASAQTLMLLP